jgi:hypothetical protein
VILHDDGTPDSVVCVGQASHAWVSGQLARAWGGGGFERPEPWEDVCLAVEQHDIGMAEWDERPALDERTGLPLSFLKMPEDVHLRLWSAAPGKVLTLSPYAALLVSMHGHALLRQREPSAAIDAYLAAQEALQRDLLEAVDGDRARASRNRQLLWALDHLSLALLVPGWSPAAVLAPGPGGADRAELLVELVADRRAIVDPWPFTAQTVGVVAYGRRLAGRFADEPALHAALDDAPWVPLRFELRPA